MRIVILSHGHPDYATGGSEMAAYSLFRAFAQKDPASSYLISWIPLAKSKLHSPGSITRLNERNNEWLWHCGPTDPLYHFPHSRQQVLGDFISFVRDLRPDVIHLNHFLGFGLDTIRYLKLALPKTKLVMTLHEFLAICFSDGQMITARDHRLCTKSSPLRCSQCFPQFHRSHFGLREFWFKSHFDLLDGLISPSDFLRERYINWGIHADRIVTIPNAQICTTLKRGGSAAQENLFRTFGFFGQLNPYKGVDILIRAATLIKEITNGRNKLSSNGEGQLHLPKILVFGSIDAQSKEFKETVSKQLEQVADLVEYRGPYDRIEVIDLMSSVGWIVVPSIWWENSPVVIEEAFYAGRPVICSDIGGMKEKVEHQVNGLHFRVKDPQDLAYTLLRAAEARDLWDRLSAGVRKVCSLRESAESHLRYYRKCADASRQRSRRKACHDNK